jgi:nucleoside-diphosphate-sugar epimerase
MRIVVVGASGNVGSSVVQALVEEPRVEHVIALARRPPRDDGRPGLEWREADVTSSPLEPLVEGADAVVHLVGRIEPADRPRQLAEVNVGSVARVLDAVAAAAVPTLIFASSTAAYAPAAKTRLVDESWPLRDGSSSPYARQKAEAERELDAFEQRAPEARVVRLRFDAVFKRSAGAQARDTFLGRVPRRLVRPDLLPFVPEVRELRFQGVHADDLAEAFRLTLLDGTARGAYNVAAEPVLDARTVARAFGSRVVPALPGSVRALRAALGVAHRAGLAPLSPSWLDFVLEMPLIDAGRLRRELGWEPRHRADDALVELVRGIRRGASGEAAALAG